MLWAYYHMLVSGNCHIEADDALLMVLGANGVISQTLMLAPHDS